MSCRSVAVAVVSGIPVYLPLSRTQAEGPGWRPMRSPSRPPAPCTIRREPCPRRRRGPIYRSSLWRAFLNMHEQCPHCALKFEREQGYFVGAMYIS